MMKRMVNAWRKSESFYNFKTNPLAIMGAGLLAFFMLMAIVGPFLTPQDPYNLKELSLDNSFRPPVWLDGEARFALGTDQQGRDLLSGIVYGVRISMFVGVSATILSLLLGTFFGIIAGYRGGWVDSLIMRIADVQLSFPSMLIALFIMVAFGRGIEKLILALTLVGWVTYARTVRGSTLAERNKEYVEAARVCGFPAWVIMFRHILPNVLTPLIVIATIQVGNFILTEATLSFLGVGVPITKPSLGLLLSNGYQVLFSGLWWVSVFPGIALLMMVVGVNLLGDFLRDELNPRLK
jgi:peptide/nickel transport system permease protein